MLKKGLTCLFAIACTAPAWGADWVYVGKSGFTHTNVAQMRDYNRIQLYDAVVDFEGNLFFSAGPCINHDTGLTDRSIPHGVTIRKADGTIINVDLSQDEAPNPGGLNLPGAVTKLVVAGDNKVYGIQNWQEIHYNYDDGLDSRLLRFNVDGTVDMIVNFGTNGRWVAPTLSPRGLAVGGDGHVYWTRAGENSYWKTHLLWRYNVITGQVEESPTAGVNNGWSQTHRLASDILYVEDGVFSILNWSGTSMSADKMSWSENREVITKGTVAPGWGVSHMVKTAYDPLLNKVWFGPRSSSNNGQYTAIMGRINGADGNTGLFTPNGLKDGFCYQTWDVWHANGHAPTTEDGNGGHYWIAELKIDPAFGVAWATWGTTVGYNYVGDFGAMGPIYTFNPYGCGPEENEGNPQTALNQNPSQTTTVAFGVGTVYATTVDLTTGEFNIFSAPAAIPASGACCMRGNACTDATENECLAMGGQYAGDDTSCATHTCNVVGACCQQHGCTQEIEADCNSIPNSRWEGVGTSCADFNCPTRLCQDPIADADGDGDVDQVDFGVWQSCITLEGQIADDPVRCGCYDVAGGLDGGPDGLINAADFGPFVNCGTGPSIPVNPNCDD